MSRTSRVALALPVLFLVAGLLTAQSKAAAKAFTVWPVENLKWVALKNAPPGPMLAVISGDPEKGPYKAIEKFPAGFSAPLHSHPATHKAVIISGTWIHGEPGKPDVKLGPGSYLVQPAGMKHTTACDAGADCMFFIDSSGKFGITMAEAAKK
jgi:uncharacterized protein DUF4437